MIPGNLLAPLQAFGLDADLNQRMSYANGVMMVLTGNTQDNSGDNTRIITQDLQSGLANLGLTTGDLAQFLLTLDDNLKALIATRQGQDQGQQAPSEQINFLRLFYFTAFLEYIKIHSVSDKYLSPQEFMNKLHGNMKLRSPEITPEDTAGLVSEFAQFQVYDKNKYALTVNNPSAIAEVHICPWIFVYNNKGETRIFMSKQDMMAYDEKYGGGPGKIVKDMFTGKNLPLTIILIGGTLGIGVGVAIFAKRKHNKKVEEKKQVIAEIEAEAGLEYDTEAELLDENIDGEGGI